MTHRFRMTFALLLLPLSACGSEGNSEDPGPAQSASPAHPEPAAPWDVREADDGAADVAPAPASPTSAEPDIASSASQIPPSVRGRWGLVAADCTSMHGDAKGLLTIDATSLRFYESVGKLTRVRESDANHILADFTFSGEGMTWKRSMTLDSQDGGLTLIRRENGADAAPGPFKYTRCQG